LDRWGWSPVCSTLLAALVLESEVARADEPRPITGLDAAPALTLTPLEQEAPAAMTAPPGVVRVAAPAQPFPPAAAMAPASPFLRADEQAPPIRLDAAAVLSLNDLFPDPAPWRAAFPGYEAPFRKVEFGAEPAPEPTDPAHQRKAMKEAFSFSGSQSGWLAEHIELSFNDGISYKENFTWRGMPLRLKIWGPVLKGDPGLGVRLRGLRWNGHNVELKARATTDLQDVQIQIAF
jgi:hypothetical protein